jgi:hypothetical protein
MIELCVDNCSEAAGTSIEFEGSLQCKQTNKVLSQAFTHMRSERGSKKPLSFDPKSFKYQCMDIRL